MDRCLMLSLQTWFGCLKPRWYYNILWWRFKCYLDALKSIWLYKKLQFKNFSGNQFIVGVTNLGLLKSALCLCSHEHCDHQCFLFVIILFCHFQIYPYFLFMVYLFLFSLVYLGYSTSKWLCDRMPCPFTIFHASTVALPSLHSSSF